jgi:hypothetical protein
MTRDRHATLGWEKSSLTRFAENVKQTEDTGVAGRQGVSVNGYQPFAAIRQALPTPSTFYTCPLSGSSAAFTALPAFAAVASAMSLEMSLTRTGL